MQKCIAWIIVLAAAVSSTDSGLAQQTNESNASKQAGSRPAKAPAAIKDYGLKNQ